METFEAVGVAAVALLPGALYVWGFERQVGNWGIGVPDRLLRFFGVSAFLHVATGPLTYSLWATYRDVLSTGQHVSLWLWFAAIVYVGAPFVAGTLVGTGTRRGRPWARVVTGPNRAPRAWDHFFAGRPHGWARLRLRSGIWVAGFYTTETQGVPSYAAGYPEQQDLFLTETAEVDPATGEFILETGAPVVRGMSLLIRWDEIEFLEFRETRKG